MSQNNPQNNPFNEFFKSFDAFKSYASKVPSVDFNEVFTASQKNFETMTSFFKTYADGVQAVAKRQVEIAQANAEEMLSLFKDVASSKDPKESAAKQAKFAKSTFEKAASDAREIADIATKSNNKAMELIGKQVTENLKKISEVAKEPTSKKAA